jgi:radical SAM protein with 4Fe4S-binding SPASM domain
MECPQDDIAPQDGFFQRLQASLRQRRLPVSGSLEVTYRCNLSCAHCYLGDRRRGLPGRQELSTAEIFRLLDEITDEGCLWFLLTGGEPLVRPDLLEIYRYARHKGLLVTLFTNGTLLTPPIAAALADLPPQSVEITLYGRTQQTYERITGVPGSHARCLRGIDLLLKHGVRLKLKSMVMTLNRHELGDMQQFAASLGVEYRYDPLLNAGMDGARAPIAYRLTPEEVTAIDHDDPSRWVLFERAEKRIRSQTVEDRYLYLCGAGRSSFHIDPYGALSPCILSRAHTFDLRQGSFNTGWEQFLPGVRALPAAGGRNNCAHCSLLPLCGQCPGWSEAESGNPHQKVDYLCQVAHLRARALGMK